MDPTKEDELSQFILTAFYLANHSAGGAKGVAGDAWRKLAAYMCSSLARITWVAGDELHSYHQQFAAFLDHPSGIDKSLGIGHRFLELPGFQRWFLRWVANFVRDWKSVLPKTAAFAEAEAQRAERLELATANDTTTFWEGEMVAASEGVLDKALLYFRDALMGVGFSFLLALDPILGPLWARTVLAYLDGDANPPLTEPAPAPYDPNTEWTGLNPDYPFPEMTSVEFVQRTWDSFQLDEAATRGMIAAYGLAHEEVVAELHRVVAGEVADMLHARQMSMDARLKWYWASLSAAFPYITHCQRQAFDHAPIVSTLVEVMFSIMGNQQRPNACTASTSNNMAYQGNVRMKATSDLKEAMQEQYKQVWNSTAL